MQTFLYAYASVAVDLNNVTVRLFSLVLCVAPSLQLHLLTFIAKPNMGEEKWIPFRFYGAAFVPYCILLLGGGALVAQ